MFEGYKQLLTYPMSNEEEWENQIQVKLQK